MSFAPRGSHWAASATWGDDAEDDLTRLARDLLRRHAPGWTERRSGMWLHLAPPDPGDGPPQGWKLHVSATRRSAPAVLSAVLPLAVREGARFKIAATLDWVSWLNNPGTPRGSAGKFLTIYPRDDEQARRLGEACDRATAGIAGPAILSDRALRPGGLVHYRYGAFRDDSVFTPDGELLAVVRDPSGAPVPDRRNAWFTPVPWAPDPFRPAPAARPAARAVRRGEGAGEGTGEGAAREVLLDGRYLVRRVLKHANKGGVYAAEDRADGRTVVIKEARPHVEGPGGGDVRDTLRHEARLLEAVAGLGLTPRPLGLFEQQGHLFLTVEHIPGEVLREHVAGVAERTGRAPAGEDLRALVLGLADLMDAMHRAGLLLRDFSPNNVMVLPDLSLRLVDLELAHRRSSGRARPLPHGTPGFGSPGQMAGRSAVLADDYYGLGATIAYTATGMSPPAILSGDLGARVRDWIEGAERDGLVGGAVCDIVLGCMDPRPARRWSPRRVREAAAAVPRPRCAHEAPAAGEREAAALVRDAAWWLVENARPDRPRMWPVSCDGLSMDPCNAQSGASGTGLAVCALAQAGPDLVPEPLESRLRETAAAAASWVSAVLGPPEAITARPPGLYFGACGAAWFLAEASALLGDPALLARAAETALAVPPVSFNPDLTHGTAGIGLTQLRLWRRTGDQRFAERAGLAARALAAAAEPGPGGVLWRTAGGAPSQFAGRAFYGFAHGNAGIAYFLLCAAAALGEPAYEHAAREGLETLLRVAVPRETGLSWDSGPERPYGMPHWCNGSAGVGIAMDRGYRVTGDPRYLRAARGAAEAVVSLRRRSGLVRCHGLAGGGDLLLDLFETTGERRFRDRALESAAIACEQRVPDGGRSVVPDESLLEVTAGLNTGLAGVAAFVLRALRGGPALLMADDLLAARPAGHGTRAAGAQRNDAPGNDAPGNGAPDGREHRHEDRHGSRPEGRHEGRYEDGAAAGREDVAARAADARGPAGASR
ncbi:class IV lanthionine synthetase LanL [Bailinhaonella thermotolerans]|uniref:Protein kinase domain-containing protein n=1 Tax=Bailinhaonella thermotolerans TaxID=1070861 RepID=A0A3A4B1L9_9ACTN|nr:class IV lanthionine synthetase LanL [Bailinhaonella thermotolerans]RJL34058.1 hypothetical protein D5H75_06020 [Bailinhaonella thermotolerans]